MADELPHGERSGMPRRLLLAAVLLGGLLGLLHTAPLPAEGAPEKHKCKPHPRDHDRGGPWHGACRGDDEDIDSSSLEIRYVPGELLVRFRPSASEAERSAAVDAAGGTIIDHLPALGVHVVQVAPARTQDALESLRSSPTVEAVEQDVFLEGFETIPDDPLWSTQWGLRVIGAPTVWDSTTGMPSVVIAVLDTGIDAQHPDLAGATVSGHDFVNDDADPTDDDGHGTSAAGVLAARSNNGQGLAGVCWACSLMPIKVLDAQGSGKTSTIAAGLVWATDHGARIVNMSLGGPGTTSTLASAIDYASAKGAVLVAAAGNSGVDTPFYPAAYAAVMSVAGTTESDSLYSWSNHGSWVQLAAPGCNTAPARGGGYVQFCGTSSAAPMVAGVAGLALSLKPAASREELQQAITGAATSVSAGVRYGRVNAPSSISAIAAGGSTPVTVPAPVVAPPASPPPAAVPPALPALSSAPTISGVARVGFTLRASPGAWSGATPVTYTFAWLRCDRVGGACGAVNGAAAQTYSPALADVGATVRVRVTATNAAGAATAESAQTARVTIPPPVNLRRPRLRGLARVGRVLRVVPGSWSLAPVRFVYRWQRCAPNGGRCRTIAGAQRQRYRLTRRLRGYRLRAIVIAANRGGRTTAATGVSSVVRLARRA